MKRTTISVETLEKEAILMPTELEEDWRAISISQQKKWK